MGREVTDEYYQKFRADVEAIRHRHTTRVWEPGIPVKWVASRDYSGNLCICQNVPGGFECATCSKWQPYHEGKCNDCGAELILCPDWEEWWDLGKRRERTLIHQFQQMFRA